MKGNGVLAQFRILESFLQLFNAKLEGSDVTLLVSGPMIATQAREAIPSLFSPGKLVIRRGALFFTACSLTRCACGQFPVALYGWTLTSGLARCGRGVRPESP